MRTQTERESNKSCRTGDNKCVPNIEGQGGGGIQDFLIGLFKFIKGGFDLLILPDYLLIFSDFSENSP